MQQILTQLVQGTKRGGEDDGQELHNVTCDECGDSPIRDDRYKCLQCHNFNLCAGCFERRVEPKNHKNGHLLAHFRLPNELFGRAASNDDVTLEKLQEFYAKEENKSVTCDGCHVSDFVGLRFKCDSCPDYDLCLKCATTGVTTDDHKLTHPLILTFRRVIVQISINDIELGEKLGSGNFGTVYKARWISKNRPVACKIIVVPDSKEPSSLEKSFAKELSAYIELSGGYILKTYGYAAGRQENKSIYMIIMEYMPRGSLTSVIKSKTKISLQQKVNMARQIASAMRKIHDHHMIHRDIRPDNILVNQQYTCKIGDMGIARVVDPLNQHTRTGCQSFLPPEFYSGTYDQKLDIFMFGLTLNELFTEKQHNFRMFAKEKIVFQEESPIFQDLITRCTANDPKHRPAAIEIEKTLEFYAEGFECIVIKNNPNYVRLSIEQKNQVYIKFYEKFHKPATEFIRKQFPAEFLEGSTTVAGVRVKQAGDKDEDGPQIICHIQ
ncbi:unnamed protein product [Rotaria sp. Silwood2]|nr:unnamed protein product [Rotaria sp. Silwood2]